MRQRPTIGLAADDDLAVSHGEEEPGPRRDGRVRALAHRGRDVGRLDGPRCTCDAVGPITDHRGRVT